MRLSTSWKAICIYRQIRKSIKKKNHKFICKSSWNKAVCFLDFNLFRCFFAFLDLNVMLSISEVFAVAGKITFSFIFKRLFMYIFTKRRNAYSRIRHVFVYQGTFFSCIYQSIRETERVKKKHEKKFHKQKQCIENGSLCRAFNELLFSLCIFTDFNSFDIYMVLMMQSIESGSCFLVVTLWERKREREKVRFFLHTLSIMIHKTSIYHRNHHPAYMHSIN